ncbi:hypothetical protein I6A84_25915 [Frankia sp. CNm7]|uniref:Uncharacterized protein n=1 Tax=Frankia nepalensis TaxID=1836974 RepID=A0A937RBH0_9ACTN|nr:hypothetical protein [Frankia nepalensis]MBL7495276.1 hypothetical protein [Frankia nepalensis]MBL7515844.1 hypothetical protein [Frankia nepalensis]MBL7521426.1 hypothetical protein [Frankia nepalensis]MBL7629001.1 hypothetical protein [Frankia nepalensis]
MRSADKAIDIRPGSSRTTHLRPTGQAGLVAVALAVALALAGCAGSDEPTDSLGSTPPAPASTAATAPTSTEPSAPPMTAEQRDIVERYRLYWRTVEQVLATNDVDSPALRDVATSNQLITLIEKMIKNEAEGITVQGTVVLDPGVPVIADGGLSASLRDCQDGSGWLPYHDGKVDGVGVPRRDGVAVTLWLVDEVWKVAATVFTEGRCDET